VRSRKDAESGELFTEKRRSKKQEARKGKRGAKYELKD